jgi:AcrR family transcriptional regulator
MSTAKPRARSVARRVPRAVGGDKARGRGKYDRARSPADRHEEQRSRLLDAAATVFANKGFPHASVADIVVAAGMSRRTFYEHFDDIENALLQVHERSAGLAFRFVEEKVRATTDPLARVHAGVKALLQLLSENGDLARVVFRELRAAGPKYTSLHEAMLSRFVSLLFEGVADAYAKGIATRAPDELTIFALVSAVEAVAMRYVNRREEARAVEATDTLVELVVRAFR